MREKPLVQQYPVENGLDDARELRDQLRTWMTPFQRLAVERQAEDFPQSEATHHPQQDQKQPGRRPGSS